MAIAQAVTAWREVEELREVRFLRELEVRRELKVLRRRVQVFERTLEAQVAFEEARAKSFAAVMAALPALGDSESRAVAFRLAQSVLERPSPVQLMPFSRGVEP